MPSEPANLDQPKHPMHALTTYELRNYRRELERALETLPSHATVREQFRQRLTDVLTEEQARTQLQQAGRS
jgi:predicted component of type VI protein secretion system